MSEFKQLRKIEFPESIMEGFRYLERLAAQEYARNNQPSELFCTVADEFIFLEIDRLNSRRRRITPVQELQVLEKMTSYFSDSKMDIQQIVFLWMFAPRKPMSENKLSLLTKLVSMAITDLNTNILNNVAMWMQMSDCGSEASLHVAKAINQDYFLLMSTSSESLLKLPFASPLFCSSFLCALTALHKPSTNVLPPQRIIEVILEWLAVAPTMCFSPLKMVLPYKLPGPQTPIPGLVFWCIKQPLSLVKCDPQLFSKLHLTLLEILLHIGHLEPSLQQFKSKVIPATSVVHMIGQVRSSPGDINSVQMAQNRLAQAVHVALCSGCLQPTADLFGKLGTLSNNRLVCIIIDKWKSTGIGQ